MNQIIHVGGAKGVGKTTLLKEINGFSLKSGQKLTNIHVSDFLNEFSIETYKTPWQNLKREEKEMLRLKSVKKFKSFPHEILLLDSHCVDMINGEAVKIIPSEFEKIIDGYIVITSSPEIIYERRKKDGSRLRDLQLVNIKKEIEFELSMAENLAARKNIELVVIDISLPEITKNDILKGIETILKKTGSLKEGNKIENESFFHNIERF